MTPYAKIDDRTIFDTLLTAVKQYYDVDLFSCAIFGSYARRVQTPESDLDVLIVADKLPNGRMKRVRQFDEVERALRDSNMGKIDISPIFKSREEAKAGSPLFWDMTEYVIILFDREGFLEALLDKTRDRLECLGAKRVQRGNAWYWILKEDFTPGEVFEL